MKVELQNVCFAYAENRRILEHFSLSFPERGTVCLLGRSGCGKTTLLRLLAGLEVPQSGCVLRPAKTAVVFQEDRLLPWATARSNVAAVLPAEKKEALRQAGEWLQKLGLAGSEDVLPGKLSGGMRQRVALARALAFKPELLLLDEPFHALDAETRAVCAQVLKEEGTQKLTILVTHNLEEAKILSDCTYCLQGSPLQVLPQLEV